MKQAQETWASLKEGPKVTLNQGLLWNVLLCSNYPGTPPCSGTFLGATEYKYGFFQKSTVYF